jgi:hypothetical protein
MKMFFRFLSDGFLNKKQSEFSTLMHKMKKRSRYEN